MTNAKRSRGTDLSFFSPFFLSPFSLAVHKDVAFDAHGVRGAEPASVSGSGNGGPEKEEEEERREIADLWRETKDTGEAWKNLKKLVESLWVPIRVPSSSHHSIEWSSYALRGDQKEEAGTKERARAKEKKGNTNARTKGRRGCTSRWLIFRPGFVFSMIGIFELFLRSQSLTWPSFVAHTT